MLLRRPIGTQDVLLECNERFLEDAEALLRKLGELDQYGPKLADGTKVQFGWSVLSLRAELDALRVCEPDFFGDALHAVRPTVDVTLEVLTEQVEVLRAARESGIDARFDRYVVSWPEALDAKDIFLRRQMTQREDSTGWFVGDLAHLESRDSERALEALFVFDVLRRRRSIMKMLALPPGYTVLMRGARVESMERNE